MPETGPTLDDYVLAHGAAGRARLQVLARALEEGTRDLFRRVGVPQGASCLDVGCGGGDVSVVLAREIGPSGRVVGVDLDPETLEAAKRDAELREIGNVAYRQASVFDLEPDGKFGVVYARFLLTHLADVSGAIGHMLGALAPGGSFIVEEIDFAGHFCFPDCPALRDYIRLYSDLVESKGGDPYLGLRIPGLLREAGLASVEVRVSQPAGLSGDVKVITPVTMLSVGPRLVEAGLAAESDVARIAEELMRAADDPDVFMGMPRIIQAWGREA